jgi:RNA polymerase sigma-70 factor (ECF subfamily)
MLVESSDQQLIQECLKGAQRSFKALYEKYQAYVYTICVRHGVSTNDIKDHMQVIFMEIFNALDRYDDTKAAFKTWITRITINQILHQKRKRNIDYSTGGSDDLNLINSSFNIPIEWNIDQKELYTLLNKMPEKYITAFNLSIIDGYNHSEIAEQLNIPESTSRVLVHRGRIWAMKHLRTNLKEMVSPFDKNHKII